MRRSLLATLLILVGLSGCGGIGQSHSGVQPYAASVPIAPDAADREAPSNSAAQTQESVLYSFAGGSDGQGPEAGLTNANGVFYGTTTSGGANGYGTVFKITKSGAESVIHSFGAGSDGTFPFAGLTNVNGVLYGTTEGGGGGGADRNNGTVFKITTSGAETVLHSFASGSDGSQPYSGLTEVSGALYGTTSARGNGSGCNHMGCGTIFEITTSGAESVLYRFASLSDGASPSGLTNVGGVLYGTSAGGANRAGTVYKITTSGAKSVLYNFAGGSDGESPNDLANVNGVLYGTTYYGGTAACAAGCGTVFKISTSGAEQVLHRFGGGSDGRSPDRGMTNVNGVLYGTTSEGGSSAWSSPGVEGCGTVFRITTSGAKSAVYRFLGGDDGAGPLTELTDVNGVLYGTTFYGGANKLGTVFFLSL